jgi:hypothetical protein
MLPIPQPKSELYVFSFDLKQLDMKVEVLSIAVK